MKNRMRARWATVIIATALLSPGAPAMAAKAVALRAHAEVRSAPFAIAPIIGYLDLDATVTADDQATNGWRRVRLPNGVFGFVADSVLGVGAIATAPAPAAAQPAASVPPALPQLVAARVKVFELTARAQPAASAVVLRVFPNGALLTVAPRADNGWRRTQLPDGQTAYLAEAGLDFGPAPEVPGPTVQPLAPPPGARPEARIYVADLDHLASLVGDDRVVSARVDSLQARREGAIAAAVIGDAGGLVVTGLGLFAFESSDCTRTGGACTQQPNMAMVAAGLGLLIVSTAISVALLPKRRDLFGVVNAWNPRHLDEQITVGGVSVDTSGAQAF